MVAADVESRTLVRIFAGIPWGKGRFATRWGGGDYSLADRLYAHVGQDVTLIMRTLRGWGWRGAERATAGTTATGPAIARLCAMRAVENLPVAVEARPGVAHKARLDLRVCAVMPTDGLLHVERVSSVWEFWLGWA